MPTPAMDANDKDVFFNVSLLSTITLSRVELNQTMDTIMHILQVESHDVIFSLSSIFFVSF